MNLPTISQGIVCALWTPLTADGRIDVTLLERHLEWLGGTGLDGLLALGSTGRFAHLPVEQREILLRQTFKSVSKLPVLVNVSDLDQRVVARLGSVSRAAGAAGVAVLPPWYFEYAQADLVEWFVTAGEAAGLPLWLYNFPERTGNRIELGTVKDVLARVPTAGFKQSGADHALIRELAKLAATTPFAVFAGADARIPEALELGAVGCIGGLANALPEAMVRVYRACRKGNPASAADPLRLLREVNQRLHLVPFPINIAAVMEARGLNPGALPTAMSRVTRAHYEQLKSEVRGLLAEHGPAAVA
jgi:dihydrodipicolinate synthase/N-acetylneuraminate lyase